MDNLQAIEYVRFHDSSTQLFLHPVATATGSVTSGSYNGAEFDLKFDFSIRMLIITVARGGATKKAWLPETAIFYMVPKSK